MANDLFEFATPAEPQRQDQQPVWKLLTVEDDPTYRASLIHSLNSFRFRDTPLKILTAGSAAEAGNVLSEHSDIALILLDVVMERDDAGLRLVRSIREVLGNSTIRIVLLTGQPGMAPRADVMQRYDIDEYWNKSELTRETLYSVVSSHLRTWHYMVELQRAQQGLQMILDASRSLYSRHDKNEFTQQILENICKVISVDTGGIVCAARGVDATGLNDINIIAASGSFYPLRDQHFSDDVFSRFHASVQSAIDVHGHVFTRDFSVLYFETSAIDGFHYLVVVDSPAELSENEINLLKVFSENIRSGFTNVALLNRLSYLAYFDEKLGISNRNGLLRELSSLNQNEKNEGVLMLVSMRSFRDMMITFGEHYCDILLLKFAELMMVRFPQALSVANLGDGKLAMTFCRRSMPDMDVLLAETEQTMQLEGVVHHLLLTFCTLELNQLDDFPVHETLHLAEATLAKAEVANCGVVNTGREHKQHIASSFLMLQKLQQALLNEKLTLMLQPKVDLVTGRPVGFEALVRWFENDGSVIPPGDFIPLAEASGLISSLDIQVLRMAIEAICQLRQAGYDLPVSFNATAADLRNRDYMQKLNAAIDDGLVNPSALELEITESEAIRDYTGNSELLARLIEKGMGVSIDDFGTGYSSLAHITQLAATSLKIDRCFVQGLGNSENDRHVVQMIIRIGQRFGFNIIAEGVETEQQRHELIEAGCRIAQGFLFARPMSINDAIDWLRRRS